MTEKNKIDVRTAELLLATWRASREGKLKVAPQFRELAEEFMSAPLTMTGIVDTSRLSETALSFGRTSGMAIGFTMQHEPETASSSPFSFSKTDFTELPVALIKWGHLNRLKVVVENDQETFFVSGYRLERLPNSKWRCLPKRRQLLKITEIERHSSRKIPKAYGLIRYENLGQGIKQLSLARRKMVAPISPGNTIKIELVVFCSYIPQSDGKTRMAH